MTLAKRGEQVAIRRSHGDDSSSAIRWPPIQRRTNRVQHDGNAMHGIPFIPKSYR